MSDDRTWRPPRQEVTSEAFELIAERSESLWDEEAEDDHAAEDDDGGEPGDALDDQFGAAWDEEFWARAYVLRERLRAVEGAHQHLVFAPDDPDPGELRAMLEELEEESFQHRRRPAGWTPDPAMAARMWQDITSRGSMDSREVIPHPKVRLTSESLDDILPRELSAEELQHWRWLQAHRRQREIELDLGVSQKTVSKREAKLRERVDQIALAHTGRPYPWLTIRHRGRPRKA